MILRGTVNRAEREYVNRAERKYVNRVEREYRSQFVITSNSTFFRLHSTTLTPDFSLYRRHNDDSAQQKSKLTHEEPQAGILFTSDAQCR